MNDEVYLIASLDYCCNKYHNFYYYLNYSSFSSYCSCCLHIGRLHNSTNKKALIDLFSNYAIIKSIRIKKQDSRFF